VGDRPFEIKFTSGHVVSAELVLRNGEVCGGCNERNGRHDEYLQKQMGFMRVYWNPVGTKSGRAATAQTPGMYAERREGGIHITLNDRGPTIVNRHLGSAQRSSGRARPSSKDSRPRSSTWTARLGPSARR
jgi:hypothetical protein